LETAVALVRVRSKKTREESTVDEAWLTRWPDDFTVVKPANSTKETTPASGNDKKEKA